MDLHFHTHCEQLWQKWKSGRLQTSEELSTRFSLRHAPEPYLTFEDNHGAPLRPLYFLLTNPGKGLPEQSLRAIKKGHRVVHRAVAYHEASRKFAKHYLQALADRPAGRRISAMMDLKCKLGANCVIQLETIPFHSESLPGKRLLPELVESDLVLSDYSKALQKQLKSVSVIALSAVDTSKRISTKTVAANSWLAFQAQLMGIDAHKLNVVELVRKAKRITSAFLYQRVDGFTRGFVLTMGSNNFPAEPGRHKLAAAMRAAEES